MIEKLTTALADRYRIDGELGAGGMATVYLAHDLRHDRDVAIKVLHPDLGAALGGERFLSEIRTTARLQHPHILPLLDSGDADGLLFYVMPLVTGETLRARLERERQLPIDDAVLIAREAADALAYAHSKGVIHRDIKPENILLQGGHALVADFGIALAVQSAGGARMTQTGLSLGTPQYMSPEQAMGEKTIDARSDIYSLGAVAYEMLAGEPPFTGPSVQAIVARLITEEPRSIAVQRKAVPEAVEAAVMRALEKLPADRFASAAEFAAALQDRSPTAARSKAPRNGSQPHTRTRRWGGLAAMAVAGGGLFAAGLLAGRPRTARSSGYDVGLADSVPMTFLRDNTAGNSAFAVSRDGEFVVYVADRWGTTELWVRHLRSFDARRLPGTEGASGPFLSPDDRWVAFYSGGKLKKAPIGDGSVATLIDVELGKGGSWATPNRIIVSDDGALKIVDASTGGMSAGPQECEFPFEVRGHDLVLCARTGTIYLATLSDTTSRVEYPRLGNATDSAPRFPTLFGTGARVVDERYLLFMSVEGALQAATFDPATRRVGRVVTILNGVRRQNYSGAGQFALTATGDLVYAPGENAEVGRLVRTRDGVAFDTLPIPPIAAQRFDLSPDGRRVAVVVQGVKGQELWVYDVATGRGTLWQSAWYLGEPRWDPAGTRIVFDRFRSLGDSSESLLGSPDASTPPQSLGRGVAASDFRSATLLLAGGHRDLSVLRVDPTRRGASHDTLLKGLPRYFPTLSPDGRWLATNDERRIVLSPYPMDGTSYLVAEGTEPVWARDGTLTYWSFDLWRWRVRVTGRGNPPFEPPARWFRDPQFINTFYRSHVLTPDGADMYLRGRGQGTASYLRVVPGWVNQMKRAVDEANR